jgi:uncharacterized protein (TIGR03435 family)
MEMRPKLILSVAAVVALAGFVPARTSVSAQTKGSPSEQEAAPTFEVASVRLSDPDASYRQAFLPTGRYEARAVTVKRLILTSYDLHESQVIDAPDWIDSDRFDIVATAPDGAAVDGYSALARIRALLGDRFSLRTHTEMRELPVYELTFAREDRSLGSGLHPSTIDCAAAEQALQEARDRGEFFRGVTCRASFSGQGNGVTVFR